MTGVLPAKRICVIIPAYNAEATITDAVKSALAQPLVSEVVVIDDASNDATGKTARKAGQEDERLKILRPEENIGPAAGRNLAIANSSAPFIAILDADDYYLPDRFAFLPDQGAWDIAADNVLFVPEARECPVAPGDIDRGNVRALEMLTLEEFIRGNIPHPKATRSELGFLKPVISRAFLQTHGLSYDETLRLGEDCDLYIRMLLHGANFGVSSRVGYVARVRPDSLSGRHRGKDLEALLTASLRYPHQDLDPETRSILNDYLAHLRRRHWLHAFLEIKQERGMKEALHFATRSLPAFSAISRGVVRDKIHAAWPGSKDIPPARYLLSPK
ncbi:glycosyltransferase family 2 protein [Palleronia abyssalis]|uniref:Putative glycosyltransferase EpsJ n=1 Tax=Palleronia abyssalis TaxID=1501240 RepID=A0A2R8BZH2_9RHOB|nr:glycosyltransferase family 2 protein [Palleronia abyssalis]SPJ25540.1 putative glycosyltransferase EpsJ [Palleronia abyssalis]